MIHGLAYIEIAVSNFELSVNFYTQILGFVIYGEILSNEDGLWCQLASQNGDTNIALWQPVSSIPKSSELPSVMPIFYVKNIRVFADRLKENQVKFTEGIRERPGYLITTILDPDQNQLQLVEKT